MNDKRNWKIYFAWIRGQDYKELALIFKLSPETIKAICMSKLSDKVRSSPSLRANQYSKYRKWKRETLSPDPEHFDSPEKTISGED